MGLRFGRLAWALGALAMAVNNVGCLQERPAINRVQPDYIDKMDFIPVEYGQLTTTGSTPEVLSPTLLAREPVYYTQTTLIAKPTTSGFTGLTSYNENDKIRWEVTENYLIARQAWEYIQHAPTGTSGIAQNQQVGDVVAAYAITSHFDIRRDYNTTTGEELNVIVENEIDRPWYQRRYMRIDWSRNLIAGYNTVLSEAEWQGQLQSEPVATFINNPEDPNAPTFDYVAATDGSGGRVLNYFDFVNRAVLHPETASISDPGGNFPAIPACYLTDPYDCAPAEVTFRVAFRRMDPTRDYEPMPVSNPIYSHDVGTLVPMAGVNVPQHLDMERFGFFDQSREGYDSNHRAILDTQRVHWASRHNLWVHHHQISFGPDSGTECNFDADCTTPGQFCHIGNSNHSATHRGLCAGTTLQHLPATAAVTNGIHGTDLSCQSDDDCRQTYTGSGVSRSATCDAQTHTCGEMYFRCASDADCTAMDPNSTCDLAIAYVRSDNRGLCLMPYRQRQVRPIAYHESTGYPDYMQPVTEQIVHEWNDAFKQAVGAARQHECEISMHIDAGTQDPATNPCNTDDVHGYDTAHGGDGLFPYVGCHSPVWGTAAGPGQHGQTEVDLAHSRGWDLAACQAPGHTDPTQLQGTNARIGDLRYSMIGAITDHDQQGYWGLANIASDPETGEMVVGRGAVWQTITDYYSTWLVSLVQLLQGLATVDQFTSGQYLLDSAHQLGLGHRIPGASASAYTVSNEVLDRPISSGEGLRSSVAGALQGLHRLMPADAGWFTPGSGHTLVGRGDRSMDQGAMAISEQRVAQSRVLGDNTNNAFQRMLSLRSTSIEGAMMNQDQASLAPTAQRDVNATSGTTWDLGSPIRAQNSAFRRLRARMEQLRSGWECAMDASFSDDLLLGLAQRLASGAPLNCADANDQSVCFGGAPAQPAVPAGGLQVAVPATPATPAGWDFSLPGTDANGNHNVNWSLMQQYAAQFIHHGVLAHELGHSLGQRHNFTASADAINYNDNYWRVRGQGHPTGIRPRYEYLANAAGNEGSFYSPQEIAGRVDEWSYSSVMDYKGLNEDAHGIGRYDYAFVANGYVGMVQAFRTVASQPLAQMYGANVQGNGLSSPLDLTMWNNGNGPIRGFHYSQIPTIYGTASDGTPNIGDANRFNIFLRETAVVTVPGFGDPAFSNQTTAVGDGNSYSSTTDSHLLVPYRFDSDERAGLVWQDQRYDAGPDIYESLHYVQERWLNYYFANSFARYRTGFSPQKYVTRMWSRYLDQMRQTTQIAAYDIINFQDFFGTLPGWNTYLNDPNAFGGYQNGVAMAMTADTLVAQMTMPEIGTHHQVTTPDNQQLVSVNTTTTLGFTIPVNFGRSVTSTWNNTEAGFWWYEQFNRAGSYYDKVMSLEAFTDPELNLLGRTTSGDLRQYELNLYTMFPEQTLRFFGGLLSEDYRDFAPIVSMTPITQPDGTVINPIQRTHLATLNLPAGPNPTTQNGRVFDTNHQALDPEAQFTIQLYSAVEAVAQIPATYDQTFMSYARLWLDGSVGAIMVSDADSVQFQDPWTHENYRALHFSGTANGTGPNVANVGASTLPHVSNGGAPMDEAGIAARMLLHARDLDFARVSGATAAVRTAAEDAERKYIELLVIMRNLTTQFGSGQYVLPSDHNI